MRSLLLQRPDLVPDDLLDLIQLHPLEPLRELPEGGASQQVLKEGLDGDSGALEHPRPLSLSGRLSTALQSFQSMIVLLFGLFLTIRCAAGAVKVWSAGSSEVPQHSEGGREALPALLQLGEPLLFLPRGWATPVRARVRWLRDAVGFIPTP